MNNRTGKFQDNGGCGFVLKPEFMRVPPSVIDFDAHATDYEVQQRISVRLLSGHYLPKPNKSSRGVLV